MTNPSEPQAYDWEVGTVANRGWEGFPFIVAWEIEGFYTSTEPSLDVMCPVCGREVDGYNELKLRWDGVLVCKDDWDPRPRNYRRRPIRTERPRNLNAPGALTFLDDSEGRE